MKTIKLKSLKTNKIVEFKPYQIGELPKGFDKVLHMNFNKNGLTYIEKQESVWDLIK